MDGDAGDLHLAVCRRFGVAVASADGQWQRRSPCPAWRAVDVVEHVIGFHDVLLLGPLGLKPPRSRDDPLQRWEVTYHRIAQAMEVEDLFARVISIPAVGNDPARELDGAGLIPRLSQDVLVHTWDLARAVGADATLNPEWCADFLARLPANIHALNRSGMFAPARDVAASADPQARLLARLGRDPQWHP